MDMTAEGTHILKELQEQTKWLRLLGLQTLRPLLEATLRSEKHKAVYDSSDGVRSARDVGKLVGISHTTVANLWSQWIAIGICTESSSVPGRAKHVTSLASLGLKLATVAISGTTADEEVSEEMVKA